MTHLYVPLPSPVVEAISDADPRLVVYIRGNALGGWTFLLGPLMGALVITSAGIEAALVLALFTTVALALGFVLGHLFHRRSVEADRRTPIVRNAARLTAAYNGLAPVLDAALAAEAFPPDSPRLAEARSLRLDVQAQLGAAEALTRNQPRLGRGKTPPKIQPLVDKDPDVLVARIEALTRAIAALPKGSGSPRTVLRFRG